MQLFFDRWLHAFHLGLTLGQERIAHRLDAGLQPRCFFAVNAGRTGRGNGNPNHSQWHEDGDKDQNELKAVRAQSALGRHDDKIAADQCQPQNSRDNPDDLGPRGARGWGALVF